VAQLSKQNSLVTAGTDCTVSQHLWDVTVNWTGPAAAQAQSPKVLWVVVGSGHILWR